MPRSIVLQQRCAILIECRLFFADSHNGALHPPGQDPVPQTADSAPLGSLLLLCGKDCSDHPGGEESRRTCTVVQTLLRPLSAFLSEGCSVTEDSIIAALSVWSVWCEAKSKNRIFLCFLTESKEKMEIAERVHVEFLTGRFLFLLNAIL